MNHPMARQVGLVTQMRGLNDHLRAIHDHVRIVDDHSALHEMMFELGYYIQLAAQPEPMFTEYGFTFMETMCFEIKECIRDITKRNKIATH